MSDQDATAESDHPDTTAAGLRRRAFIKGATGAAVAGAMGVSSARSDRGEREDEADEREDEDETEAEHEREDDGASPALIAHRGFAGLYPENTVGAVEAASRGGTADSAPSQRADLIEIDVVPTADDDVVVFHDDRLAERDGGQRGLTDTSGVVWETSTDTVTDAEVLGSSETVPLLSDVLDAIPASVGVNVELKNPGSVDLEFAANLSGNALQTQKDIWQPFVADVLDVVDDHENHVIFSSFYEAALATTRDASEYPVAPLLWDSIEDGLAIARTYDAEAIHPPYNMIKGTPFFRDQYFTEGSDWTDIDLVSVAAREGRDVNVYTLDTWYQAEQLAAAGVDGLIADHSDLLRFGATTT
jgi:glycerophosphoryl diester phosphodiesterase